MVIEVDVAMHLRKTYQKISQIMWKKIDKYDLNLRLLHILMYIDKDADISQKELSKKMKLTRGAISSSIKRLINLDLLEQLPLKTDMRYKKLIITPGGRQIIDDYREHVNTRYRHMFIDFSHEEMMEFNQLLLKINKNIDKIMEKDNISI